MASKRKVGNPIEIAISHSNIGDVYLEQKKLKQAIEHFSKAVKIYKELGSNFSPKVAEELESLAACYFLSGRLEKAVSCNLEAQRIRENIQKRL